MDLGAPSSYLVLAEDAPVYASDAATQIGTVARVLAVPEEDVFDGLLLDTPDGERFVDADGVESIHERGVVLGLAADEAHHLHAPSASPAVMEAGPDDTVPTTAGDRIRRAWNYLSGKY